MRSCRKPLSRRSEWGGRQWRYDHTANSSSDCTNRKRASSDLIKGPPSYEMEFERRAWRWSHLVLLSHWGDWMCTIAREQIQRIYHSAAFFASEMTLQRMWTSYPISSNSIKEYQPFHSSSWTSWSSRGYSLSAFTSKIRYQSQYTGYLIGLR